MLNTILRMLSAIFNLALIIVTLLMLSILVIFLPSRSGAVMRLVSKVSKFILFIYGIKIEKSGVHLSKYVDLVIANHISYLDVLAIVANTRPIFVAKREISRWPFLSIIFKRMGVIFVTRNKMKIAEDNKKIKQALMSGGRIFLFPEGTTSCGARVLKMSSSVLEPFIPISNSDVRVIQLMTITYSSDGSYEDGLRRYSWVGNDRLLPHMWSSLFNRNGVIHLHIHEPELLIVGENRKQLAEKLTSRSNEMLERMRS